MLGKLGGLFGRAFEALTPMVESGRGMGKFRSGVRAAFAEGGPLAAGAKFFKAGAGTYDEMVKTQKQAFGTILSTGMLTRQTGSILGIRGQQGALKKPLTSMGIADWAMGLNYRDKVVEAMGGQLDMSGIKRRMMTRLAIPALTGASVVSDKLLGEDNNVGKAARFGRGLGINGAIATGLGYGVSPKLGYGYLGWSAFNAIRPGSHFGPF